MFNEDNLPWRTNPLIFHSSPATLVSLASSAVAMVCWRHRLDNLYLDEMAYLGSGWFINHELSSTEIFKLPRSIRNLIDRHIERIAEELRCWWDRHDEFFNDIGYKMILKYFDFIVLDFNGNINYNATSRNILISGQLSPVEEFRMSCGYCLESDIERLWPLVSEHDCFKDVHFNEDPILYYWICRMKNELDKIPGDVQHSVEYRTLKSLETPDLFMWPQIEYFWGRFHVGENLMDIKFSLYEGNLGKYLLPKLNQTQLDEAVRTRATHILYSLARNDTSNCNYALQAWNYMKDDISKYQFTDIVYSLVTLEYIEERSYFDLAASSIYEIWSNAPDNFRQRILKVDSDCESVLDDLPKPEDCDMRWYGRDIRFLFDVLAKSNPDKNEICYKFWNYNWHKVMLMATPSDLVNCLKIIWKDDDDEFEFFKEHSLMVYEEASVCFDKFIESGLTDELIEYFKYCSSNDEEKIRKVMKDVIDSNLNRMHKFNYDALVKFNDFIDKAFSSSDLAEKFKRENILTRVESWYDLLNETHLNGVKNMVEYFLGSDTNLLTEVKRRCFEICKQNLTSGRFTSFRIREWQEFFLWCAPNEEKLAEFKKSFPIDDAFNAILIKMIKGEYAAAFETKEVDIFIKILKETMRRSKILMGASTVNGFLFWYFEDIRAALKFKLDKINNYKEVGALVELFQGRDGSAIGDVLCWFFNSDRENMKKFCKSVGFLRTDDEGEDEELDEDASESNEDEESEMDEDVSESNEDEELEVDEDVSESNE